jgi:dihydrodipicolinate synthase/N-acetylneuraminate lyase
VNTAYIANNASSVTFTLPVTAAVGDVFRIVGKGAGGWDIAQNASQTISLLGSSTTTGITGTLTPDEVLAAIEIVCTTANTDFLVISSVGNFTLA